MAGVRVNHREVQSSCHLKGAKKKNIYIHICIKKTSNKQQPKSFEGFSLSHFFSFFTLQLLPLFFFFIQGGGAGAWQAVRHELGFVALGH